MDDDLQRLSRSFGPVAQAYDRGRPGFPAEAAAWLVGRPAATVLELGAGTGKLTRELVALGHDVHASDPDADMLSILQRHLPDVPTSLTAAEDIPLPDRSVDVVVAAQALHWFDHEQALPEIARVLRPGGAVAVAWNRRNAQIPWVRKLGQILTDRPQLQQASESAVDALVHSDLFGFVDEKTFDLWQDIDRASILDLVASRSYISTLDEEARAAKLAAVLELYDDYGRGMDGMKLPYRCECFRATVVGGPDEAATTDSAADVEVDTDPPTDGGPSDGTDTDMLLIDFR